MRRTIVFFLWFSSVEAIAPLGLTAADAPGHWPQWRGPNRDNISTDTGLLREWPKDGPPLLWQVEGLGEGIASVSIAGGRVFTLGYRDELEYVTSVSEDTGEQLWMTAIGPSIAENPIMRWFGQRTPTVDNERLYAMRSDGDLVCLQVADGRELWRKSYVTDFGARRRTAWGICDYPLVDGDKLICVPDGSDATIVALAKQTGDVIWQTSVEAPERTNYRPLTYAAPVVTDGGGIRQYVTFFQKGLLGVASDDGRVLWQYEKFVLSNANSVTPIVRADLLLAYNSSNSGRALLKLLPDGQGVTPQEMYFHRDIISSFSDSTLWIDNYVHAFRQPGMFARFDGTTGERIAPERRIPIERTVGNRGKRSFGSMSSMTFAEGHMIMRNADGVVALVDPAADDYVVKSRFTLPGHEPAMGATNPVVTGGRLWLRDDNRLFCYDLRQDTAEKRPLPSVVQLQPGVSKDSASRPHRPPRSVFVRTPNDVVDRMLDIAKLTKDDLLYDLGSGDGRIVITAAKKYGCRAVGYEIDNELVVVSRERATKANIEHLVTFEQKDIFTVDISAASVIAVYLVPEQLKTLLPQFRTLKPGSRVVSHQFPIPGIEPDKTIQFDLETDGSKHSIYLWTVPLAERHED